MLGPSSARARVGRELQAAASGAQPSDGLCGLMVGRIADSVSPLSVSISGWVTRRSTAQRSAIPKLTGDGDEGFCPRHYDLDQAPPTADLNPETAEESSAAASEMTGR